MAGITQPTLVANGDNDQVMMHTENSRLLAEHLPNAELRIYPDANHGFLNQYPELFADDIVEFLTGNHPRADGRRRLEARRRSELRTNDPRRRARPVNKPRGLPVTTKPLIEMTTKPLLELAAQEFAEATAKPPYLFDLGPEKGARRWTRCSRARSRGRTSTTSETTVPGGPTGSVSVRIVRPRVRPARCR